MKSLYYNLFEVEIMMTNSFSFRLKYIMQKRGFRNADIVEQARHLNVKMSSSAVSQYLSGKYEPKPDKIRFFSITFNVPETWLMGITPLEPIRGETGVEREITALYNAMNKEGQELAIKVLQALSEKYKL